MYFDIVKYNNRRIMHTFTSASLAELAYASSAPWAWGVACQVLSLSTLVTLDSCTVDERPRVLKRQELSPDENALVKDGISFP